MFSQASVNLNRMRRPKLANAAGPVAAIASAFVALKVDVDVAVAV